MRNDAVAIICSRPESKRLHGKAFKKIAGHTALEHIIKRLSPHFGICLAVPDNLDRSQNKIYQDHSVGITRGVFFHGNPHSPLHRMAGFLNSGLESSRWILRVTHDDILVDAETAEALLEECIKRDAGYGFTPSIVEGAGIEVIRAENLMAAAESHKEPTEFISYFVQGEGLPFPGIVKMRPRESICRSYRLTMDYPEDAQVLAIVLRQVGAFATTDKICEFIDKHPYVMDLNRQPEVTIYTCARNAEKYIQQTIESVLHNHWADYEYLLIDDASTDSTPLIMSKFAKDPHVKIILNEEQKGLASSSNIALDASRGKYIMRIDADDIFISDHLGAMLHEIRQYGHAAIYPAYQEMFEDGSTNPDSIAGNLNHHAGCALMDKRVLNEIRFKDKLTAWDGLDLYNRMARRCKMVYYPQVAWYYRQHSKSMSKNNLEERQTVLKTINAST